MKLLHFWRLQLATAYSVLEFQGQAPGACLDSYTWDLQNPSEPDVTLSPLSALVCVCYNLKDNKARPDQGHEWLANTKPPACCHRVSA